MNYSLFCVLIFNGLLSNVFGRISSDLKVNLSHGGVLVGRHLNAHKGRGFRAFMGIPFAQPPLNELRFQEPVPALPWKGEKEATEDAPPCLQRDPFRRDDQIMGSEDCLYLNVFTPELLQEGHKKHGNDDDDDGPYAVMVFFHGGGWQCGSGISAFYGPDFLMDHKIVYVSGNFRLGPLGFLSTETADCPGNNGLKDQVLLLKWIQKNIAAFNGDPKRVTIFGESAGGASVTYHMMSPLSKGLFQQGISQSGTYFSPWAQPAHKGVAAKRATKLAEILNCKNNNNQKWSQIMKCLREKPADAITAAFYEFFEWDYDPMIPFPPVVEPNLEGAFISEHPSDVKSLHGAGIKWMTGMTTEEGALKTAPLLNTPQALEDFNEKIYDILPISLNYDHHGPKIANKITNKIIDFYFNGSHRRNWSINNHHNLTNLYTDGWFLGGLDKYLRIRLNDRKSGPTFVYLFDHKGAASFTEIFKGGNEHFYGVCHAEELQYLFPVGKSLFVSAAPTNRDIQMREAMLEMWVNFAKYGNPTPAGAEMNQWKPTNEYPVSYVRLGRQHDADWELMSMEKNLFQERANFWNELNAHRPADQSNKDEL